MAVLHINPESSALVHAANALFLGQQQVFSKEVQKSGLLNLPALLILGLLLFWLDHVAWGARKRKRARGQQVA